MVDFKKMSHNNRTAEKLADLIEAHPECEFQIDNDAWSIVSPDYGNKLEDEEPLADDQNFFWDTDWYSCSNLYGAGLAEALVILLNRRGFNIKSSSV